MPLTIFNSEEHANKCAETMIFECISAQCYTIDMMDKTKLFAVTTDIVEQQKFIPVI